MFIQIFTSPCEDYISKSMRHSMYQFSIVFLSDHLYIINAGVTVLSLRLRFRSRMVVFGNVALQLLAS